MKFNWLVVYLAFVSVILAIVAYAEWYGNGEKELAHEVCQSYFTGYAIQQCKERVRLGEPVFNEVRE